MKFEVTRGLIDGLQGQVVNSSIDYKGSLSQQLENTYWELKANRDGPKPSRSSSQITLFSESGPGLLEINTLSGWTL